MYKSFKINPLETFVSFVVILISISYAVNFPIDFHCDSATFYNNASAISKKFFKVGLFFFFFSIIIIYFWKKTFYNTKDTLNFLFFFPLIFLILIFFSLNSIGTPFSSFDFTRPPNYSLFLFSSGMFFFDSFKPFIFLQCLLSITSVCLFFYIIQTLTDNRIYSLILCLVFALTSIPYILITFVSAEQLLYFFIILTIFSIVKFFKNQKVKYIYVGTISSLICWLTKWEGQLIFISFMLFILMHCIKNYNSNKKLLIHGVMIFTVIVFSLLSWTSVRSFNTNNFSSIFKVSDSSMNQFIWRFYSSLPSRITDYEKKFNMMKSDSGKFISDIYPNQAPGTLIINVKNGPYTEKLYNLINKSLKENPDAYLKLKKPLDESYLDRDQIKNNVNYYNDLFGKFISSDEVVDNIFKQPNIFYFNFFDQQINSYLNKKEKSDLYFNIILESLKQYPVILVSTFLDFFYAYGINFRDHMLHDKQIYASVDDNNFIMPYNGGMCAENNLTKSHFKEYQKSHDEYLKKNLYITKLEHYTDNLNDFIVNYLGFFILLSYIILLIKNFSLFFPIVLIPFSLIFTISLLVDYPANSKYEVLYFPTNFIICSYSIFLLKNKIRNLINA